MLEAQVFPRAQLSAVLRSAEEKLSLDLTVETLGIDRGPAAKLLSRWRQQGWLRRVGPGLYVPVPLGTRRDESVVADPWILVPSLWKEHYVGGWTAAQHWDLTEQLFREIVVFTAARVTKPRFEADGTVFIVRHVDEARLFGLKTIWRGATKVTISDPARTVLDMLDMPECGGGIDHAAACLEALLGTKGSAGQLIEYADRLGNGAVFKRLGFLAETRLGSKRIAAACRSRLTQGYSKLDPALPAQKLVTAWRLWVPARLKSE